MLVDTVRSDVHNCLWYNDWLLVFSEVCLLFSCWIFCDLARGPRSSGAPVHWTAWTPGSYATVRDVRTANPETEVERPRASPEPNENPRDVGNQLPVPLKPYTVNRGLGYGVTALSRPYEMTYIDCGQHCCIKLKWTVSSLHRFINWTVFRSGTDLLSLLILFFLLLFLLGRPLQKARDSVVSNRIGMKFGKNVFHVNSTH